MKKRYFLLLLAGGGVIVFGLGLVFWPKSFAPATSGSAVAEEERPLVVSSAGLGVAVARALEGTRGVYGVVVKNLETGETYYQNERRRFEAASLYKLWVMGTVMDQIEKGKLPADTVLTAEAASEKITLTVREALLQMITISDNYAALLLTDRVGAATVKEYLKGGGFLESRIGTNGELPTATPGDTALFLEKLYKGELAGEKSTAEMLDFLRWQKLNDSLPKYLPDGVIVAHKTAALEPFAHDAGIVFADFADYVIVVLTETDSRFQAEERIALVSKVVYEYFARVPGLGFAPR